MEQKYDEDDWGLYDDEYQFDQEDTEGNQLQGDGAFAKQKIFTAGNACSKHYSIIDIDEIEHVQAQRIHEVSEETGISEDLASALLIRNEWHKQKTIDSLLQDNYLMREFNFTLEQGAETIKANQNEEEFCCECCYCEAEPHEIVQMPDCGHRLCTDCFREYCKQKLALGKDVITSSCPDQKCGNIVPQRLFKQLLSRDDYKKFSQFFRNSFVEINKRIKYCPGKDCSKVFESTLGEVVDIACGCGTSVCFGCDQEAHKPIDCKTLKKWNDIIASGAGVGDSWIAMNTKPCPKCGVRIEKNSGCMSMQCRSCGHGFCWLCLGGAKEHGGNDNHIDQCNSVADVLRRGFKLNGGKTDGVEGEYEKVRLDFFASRFNEQQSSLKFAKRRKQTIQEQIAEILNENKALDQSSFDFLLEIASLVIAARRSLSYTYPYRYNLIGENKQRYFDFMQNGLLKSLEKLNAKNEEDWTQYLDTDMVRKVPIIGQTFCKYKEEIINLQDAVTNQLNNMMDDIEAGLPDVKMEIWTNVRDI